MNIGIIGLGLMGGSFAIDVREAFKDYNIYGFDKSEKHLKLSFDLKLIDFKLDDYNISKMDLLLISVPVDETIMILPNLLDKIGKNTIVVDVGSTKLKICQSVSSHKKRKQFLAMHPIAGTEKSGPDSGFADLFKNRWCILTPSKKAKEKDINLLKIFWEKIGSKVDIMEAKQHDYILAITSHIPHLIAYNIVNTSINLRDEKKSNIIKYSAGGLRDFTRIAASDPLMWRDIFIDNSENILKVLNDYSKNLDEIKTAIETKDGEKLMKIFSSTKKVRKEIIEAGQDTEKPGFGRK